MKTNLNDKLIVALDYETPEDAFRLVDELGDEVSWYKLGPILFTQHGPEVIRFLHRKTKRIFVDLKLHDTPQVAAHTVRQLAEMGVKLTTVHTLGGRAMLDAVCRASRGSDLKLLGLTVLTSNENSDFHSLGWKEPVDQIVQRLVDTALDMRLAGVLCAPQDIAEVKKKTPPSFLIVSPGIRLPSQEIYQDDQIRFSTPFETVKAGSDYLVVGRPFIQTRDPKAVLKQIQDNLAPLQ